MKAQKYECPCCGLYSLDEQTPGSDQICKICFWQDDYAQYQDPTYVGGPNHVSLNEARENYKKIGASEPRFAGSKFVRPPFDSELSENN